MPVDCLRAWRRSVLGAALCAAVASGAVIGPARAQITPQSVELINRLCAQTMRTNEEDRLYGVISLAVRATISYRGGEFQRNVIDDAVQNALDSLLADCPRLKDADPAKRLDIAVGVISDAASKVVSGAATAKKTGDKTSPYLRKPAGKNTAADLSEELSSQEIDQWLDSMPPRERALSLFLYASNVTPQEIAAAVGEPPGALNRQLAASKADLMRIFGENWQEPVAGPHAAPPMQYSETGEGFAAVMQATRGPASPPAAPATPASATPPPVTSLPATPPDVAAPPDATSPDKGDKVASAEVKAPPPARPAPADNGLGSLKVTGISDLIYSGWSLLATARDLPRGQRLTVAQPFLLEPDRPGLKRVVVTGIAEIGDPNADTRRFLLKAYAIDADKEAAGLHDSFHLGAPLENAEAKQTLANTNLTSIEVARCLWHDFGTGEDPGLCRQPANP